MESTAYELTAADRPDDLLPVGDEPPVIETDADADKALRELAFIRGHSKAVEAGVQRRIDQIVKASGEVLAVQGKSYNDRDRELVAALESYTKKHHSKLKAGKGARSHRLQSGSIGWKKSRDAVGYVKGKQHKDAIEAIDSVTASVKKNEGGLTKRLTELLTSLVLFGRGAKAQVASLFVTAQPKINLTNAKKAYEAKQVNDEQLAQFHMRWEPGSDQFVCEPDEFERRPG